jgi:hypothetical protein
MQVPGQQPAPGYSRRRIEVERSIYPASANACAVLLLSISGQRPNTIAPRAHSTPSSSTNAASAAVALGRHGGVATCSGQCIHPRLWQAAQVYSMLPVHKPCRRTAACITLSRDIRVPGLGCDTSHASMLLGPLDQGAPLHHRAHSGSPTPLPGPTAVKTT